MKILAAVALVSLSPAALLAAEAMPKLDRASVAKLESGLRLPRGAAPLDQYARYYAAVRAKTPDELPFSTIKDGVQVRRGQPLVVGVFALPSAWPGLSPGVQTVPANKLPRFFDGGCWAVNLVYDPIRHQVLGQWCNYDNRSSKVPSNEQPSAR